jgi:hypothetical protein
VRVVAGFTGTQQGMTRKQARSTNALLLDDVRPDEVRHGLCIGADQQFHELCWGIGLLIIGHPPVNTSKMMRVSPREFNKLLPPRPYLHRNKDIVHASTVMLAAPKEHVEQLRSGTWSTIRFARKQRKRLFIVWPDGSIDLEPGAAGYGLFTN